MSFTRAYANHGRWIVECHCHSAIQVHPGTRDYRCVECGEPYTVLWPPDPAAIMRVLHPRPVANQNWTPGETIDQLRAENVEHGIPLPFEAVP